MCGPGECSGTASRLLIARRQCDVDTFLLKLFTNPLALLVLGEFDRTVVPHALHLAGRVLHVGFHQVLDGPGDGHQGPGVLGVVVHEDGQAACRLPIIAAQVEHGLVVIDGDDARGKFVLGEVEPAIALRSASAEEDR